MHEAQVRGPSMFITLTYSNEHLPALGSLCPRDLQLFIKRLRQSVRREDIKLRREAKRAGRRVPKFRQFSFFAAGEYGNPPGCRPHYHVLIFGHYFEDGYELARDPSKEKLFRSPTLESLWKLGNSSFGAVTFASARYVAQYCVKKRTGRLATVYDVVDVESGEVLGRRVPEFGRMSLRPAIGRTWFDKYRSDVFPDDFVVVEGRKHPVPRYYDKLLKVQDGELLERLKLKRARLGLKFPGERSPRRLEVKRVVSESKLNLFKREL